MNIKQIVGYSVIGLGLGLTACQNKQKDPIKQTPEKVILERDTIKHVPFDCYIPNSREIGLIKDTNGKAVSRIVEVVTKIKK